MISHWQKTPLAQGRSANVNNYQTVETKIIEVERIIENKSFNLQENLCSHFGNWFFLTDLGLWEWKNYIVCTCDLSKVILLPYMGLESHTQLTWLQPEELACFLNSLYAQCVPNMTNKQTTMIETLIYFHRHFKTSWNIYFTLWNWIVKIKILRAYVNFPSRQYHKKISLLVELHHDFLWFNLFFCTIGTRALFRLRWGFEMQKIFRQKTLLFRQHELQEQALRAAKKAARWRLAQDNSLDFQRSNDISLLMENINFWASRGRWCLSNTRTPIWRQNKLLNSLIRRNWVFLHLELCSLFVIFQFFMVVFLLSWKSFRL